MAGPIITGGARRHRAGPWLAAALLAACGEPDPAADGGGTCATCVPSCPSPEEAPLRVADGSFRCTRVGAAAPSTGGDWPDVSNAPAPVAYVGPAGLRTPSGEAPLADLAAALARDPRPATVVLARGTYALSAPLRVAAPVALRGAGAGRTTVTGPAGADAVVVTAAGAVSLQGLTVAFAGDGAATVGVRVTGDGASVSLRDVEVARAGEGVRAEAGATVCAEGLTVRNAARVGVTLTDGSHGYLRNVLVRDGAGVGVLARRSHLAVDTGMVAGNARDGVVLSGTVSGAACAGEGSGCAPAAACAGFQHEQTCAASLGVPAGGGNPAVPPESRCRSVSALANVAIVGNQVTGMRAERAAPTAAEAADQAQLHRLLAAPGPAVRASRVVVTGTGVPAGTAGGYGVYVGPTSTVSFDPGIASEAEQGRGSLIARNAGAGVLADGDPARGADLAVGDVAFTAALARAGTLRMAGARVASNGGPGLFVQRRAVAERVAYSDFVDNTFMGLGVSSGGLAEGQCDTFIATRAGVFPGLAVTLGDGVALSADRSTTPEPWRPAVRTVFEDSVFSRNARAGILVAGGEAVTFRTVRAGNRGGDNEYGVVGSRGALEGDYGAIRGRAASPAELPGSPTDYARSLGAR